MKIFTRLFALVVIAGMLLSACTAPTPTSTVAQQPTAAPAQPTAAPAEPTAAPANADVIYLNLTWHQHQPLYYKDEYGIYTRPWVRVHATKDYYDMAAMLKDYPNVKATFNITPVLIQQLNDMAINGAKDLYWVLAEKKAAELTDADKDFLLTRFFDANYGNMINVHPGYKRLLDLRGGGDPASVAAAMGKFTEQDYRDLQIWFNLAWTDPSFLAVDPLASLVKKDHDFSESDKAILFKEVERIIAGVLPLHKEMQDSGQIEMITTPLAHPILPLIYNTKAALDGNPEGEQPKQYMYVQDAIAQLDQSVEIYQQTYGREPRGLWPGEGAVSQPIVPLVGNAGYQWMASGEQVLAASLGMGGFTRNAADTVQEADALYRPYFVSGAPDGPIKGPEVMMVFRDTLLSDKLGFTYSGTPGKQAAADFMQRIANIREQLKAEGAQGPHLVSVILDGENAWENYPNDGIEFLHALYEELNNSKDVVTVTPSEYLAMFPEQRKLDKLFSGAWFSANYDTWIGEPEETAGWNYLARVREFLSDYERGKKQAPSPEALAEAFQYMYFAEGSDWFWWYGADQDSGNDVYFDLGFRQLLAKVYESLGESVPTFVHVPIIAAAAAEAQQQFTEPFTPTIDGTAAQGEWAKAGMLGFSGGAMGRAEDLLTELFYAADSKNLYVLVNAKNDWSSLPAGKLSLYVDSPKGSGGLGVTRNSQAAEAPFLLGFNASHLVEFDLASGTAQAYTAGASAWVEAPAELNGAAGARALELAVPMSLLGELQAGDELKLAVVLSDGERDLQGLPAASPAKINLPELGNTEWILEVADPEGDDHGPGAYLYPTDGVFKEGVLDVLNFKVGLSETDMAFAFSFRGPIENPWNSGSNFSVQTMDVYIDKDPGAGTGSRVLLGGRGAALSEGNGWEFAVWNEGWTPNVYAPDADGKLNPVPGASLKTVVNASTNTITFRVPLTLLGDGDPRSWAYAAMVLSQDGFPSPGVQRVRDVQKAEAQWKIGGGLDGVTNQTRIMDLVWDGSPSQEEMLSAFKPTGDSPDTLDASAYAQIELLTIK